MCLCFSVWIACCLTSVAVLLCSVLLSRSLGSAIACAAQFCRSAHLVSLFLLAEGVWAITGFFPSLAEPHHELLAAMLRPWLVSAPLLFHLSLLLHLLTNMFQCMDLAGIFVYQAGKPLLSYNCSIFWNFKGRDEEDLSLPFLWCHFFFCFLSPLLCFLSLYWSSH